MKKHILTAFIAATAWLIPARAEDLTKLLPADTTAGILMSDIHMDQKLKEHPIVKMVINSELKKVLEPLVKIFTDNQAELEKVVKSEAGLSLEEFNKLFTGSFAASVRADAQKLIEALSKNRGSLGDVPLSDVVEASEVFHFSGNDEMAGKVTNVFAALFKKTVADLEIPSEVKFPEDYELTTDEYSGAKLRIWKIKGGKKVIIPDPGIATVDGLMVLGLNEKSLKSTVDRLKKGAPSLAESPRFKAFMKGKEDADLNMFIDLGTIAKPAMDAAAKEGGVSAAQGLTVIRALGLHKFDYLSLVARLKTAELEMGLTFHDQPGLMNLFAVEGPGTVPSFLPANVTDAGYGTFNFLTFVNELEKIVRAAVPAFGDMIDQQLLALKAQLGVDIRKDLLGNLSADFWTAADSKEAMESEELPMSGTMIGIRLKDKKAFELALNTLLNKAAPDEALFEKREYQGFSINNFKDAPVESGYVITDDWAIVSVGQPQLLEKVLTRIAKSGGEDGLFSTQVVKDALAGFPAGDSGTSVMDFESLADAMLGAFRNLPEGAFGEFKPSDLPEKVNIPIVIGSKQYKDETSFRGILRAVEKKK